MMKLHLVFVYGGRSLTQHHPADYSRLSMGGYTGLMVIDEKYRNIGRVTMRAKPSGKSQLESRRI
ncbi:MAG: hypothetical protein OI74_02835 [Gammaproteobacteria bacterium (ex Lamellibrachia satsuma)]|nr:MAG: hypothetical protein NV67_15370 [Gammaproteobacteria bacterium (ex Lamellibrachia satsuma)]RRS35227.1 MAG: hypothetical protein OI74_02835 [Gammaproteobacteria bacterium (ex Lamellibrachia satsuma)]